MPNSSNVEHDATHDVTMRISTTSSSPRSLLSTNIESPVRPTNNGAINSDSNYGVEGVCKSKRILFVLSTVLGFLVNILPILFELEAVKALYSALLSDSQWYQLATRFDGIVIVLPSTAQPYWVPNEKAGGELGQREKAGGELGQRDSDGSPDDGHWELDFVLNNIGIDNNLTLPLINCNCLKRFLKDHSLMAPTKWSLKTNTSYAPNMLITVFIGIFIILRWVFPLGRLLWNLIDWTPESWLTVLIEMFVYICLCVLSISLIGTEIHENGCIEWWTWGTPMLLYQWQPTYWLINLCGFVLFCIWILYVHFAIKSFEEEEAFSDTRPTDRLSRRRRSVRRVTPLYRETDHNFLLQRSRGFIPTDDGPPSSNFCQNLRNDPLMPIAVVFFGATAFVTSIAVLSLGFSKPWIVPIWCAILLIPVDTFIRRIVLSCIKSEDHHSIAPQRDLVPAYLRKCSIQMLNYSELSKIDDTSLCIAYFKSIAHSSPFFKRVDGYGAYGESEKTRDSLEDATKDVLMKEKGMVGVTGLLEDDSIKDGTLNDDSIKDIVVKDVGEDCSPLVDMGFIILSDDLSNDGFNPNSLVITCIVCWERPAEIIADPCCHAVLCADCCHLVLNKAVDRFNNLYHKYEQSIRTSSQLPRPKIQQLIECPLCRIPTSRFFQFSGSDCPSDFCIRAVCVWDISTVELLSASISSNVERRWYQNLF